MTNEELNYLINDKLRVDKRLLVVNGKDLTALMLEALEKQIPKKPKEVCIDEFFIEWTCANCERFHRNAEVLPFCSSCGQAQDWSEL